MDIVLGIYVTVRYSSLKAIFWGVTRAYLLT